MTAEVFDPYVPRPIADWEITQVREAIQARQFDDHGLLPEVHWIEFAALTALALDGNEVAVNALRRVHQRADFGGPLTEPSAPAWSLDPEPRRIGRADQ